MWGSFSFGLDHGRIESFAVAPGQGKLPAKLVVKVTHAHVDHSPSLQQKVDAMCQASRAKGDEMPTIEPDKILGSQKPYTLTFLHNGRGFVATAATVQILRRLGLEPPGSNP